MNVSLSVCYRTLAVRSPSFFAASRPDLYFRPVLKPFRSGSARSHLVYGMRACLAGPAWRPSHRAV